MAILDSRSGKDEFVKLCQKHMIWCKNLSTVDFVKKIAEECGWDGTKTPENRAFLSELKALLTKWNDVPFKITRQEVIMYNLAAEDYGFSTDDVLVFIHCREPKEIDKFVERMGAKTLLMRRAAVENNDQSNSSDAEVFNYNYDYVIENNSSLEELEQKAIDFLGKLGLIKS